MQIFGKFSTNFDVEYLVEHYIYAPNEDEVIDVEQFEALLKNRRKTVAGTMFFYNPTMSPVGYNTNSKLIDQGYEFDDTYCELNSDDMAHLVANATKSEYKGKLIEIKYLFNINKANIEQMPILEVFENDLNIYNSFQLTRFDKELNYQDYLNLRLSGKFVFFGWGHKYEKHHKSILTYARNIAIQAEKLGKEIVYMYDNTFDKQESKENAHFLSPLATGKLRLVRANAFKNAFRTNPPTIQKIG
ncbi:MAG: hypothetical protein NTZ60_02540 [Campylobacterales bacterium]|nr:hypothetical protein [Campylobacterales bacterium]